MRSKKLYLEELRKQVNRLDKEIDNEQAEGIKKRLEENDKMKRLQSGQEDYSNMGVEEAFFELKKNASLSLMKQLPKLLSISLRTFK